MLKNIFSYGAANIIAALISFAVMPIFTRELGPEDFSRASLFISLVWIMNVIVCLNLTVVFNIKFKKLDSQAFARLISSSYLFVFSFSFLWLILLLIFKEKLSSLIGLEPKYIFAALIGSLFNILFQLYQSYQMLKGEARGYGIFQVAYTLTMATTSVGLIFLIANKLDGRILGLSTAYISFGLLALYMLNKKRILILEFAIKDMQEGIGLALTFLPHMLGVFLFSVIDRFIVFKFFGASQAGSYMAAVYLAGIAGMLISATNRAAIPFLYERLGTKIVSDEAEVRLFIRYYMATVLLLSIVSFFIAPIFCNWFLGEGYEDAGSILPWLVLGQAFFACYTVGSNILSFFEKGITLSKITLSTGLINIVLIYSFLKYFGIKGVAYAFVLSMFLRFIIVFRNARNEAGFRLV